MTHVLQGVWMRKVWKVAPVIAGALVIYFLAVANGQARPQQPRRTQRSLADPRIGNSVVAAQANSAGRFSIGTANNLPLLYDFPNSGYRSHVNVWLDGKLFSNEPGRTELPSLTLLRPAEILSDGALMCEYGFEGMLLEQRLRHEQYSDSTGAIFIQYALTNPTGAAHELGLLLELDTKVNDNDKTPFLTNYGYRNDEVVFQGAGIPDFIQAFEALPPQPGLVAKFTLTGAAATPPDFIAIGDWINLSKAKWLYAPDTILPFYNDSAVLLRWNPTIVAPGESRVLGTYYGLGEIASRTDALTLSVIAPARLLVQGDTLSPNPFSVSAFVTNTGFAAAHNVRARLLLPNELQLVAGESSLKEISPRDLLPNASGTTTWKVQARCAGIDSVFHLRVEVFADDAPGNAVTRALEAPSCFGSGFTLALTPRTQSLVAGDSAHVRVRIDSRGNFQEEVALTFWPELPGFSAAITPARVMPGASAQINFATRNTLLAGDYRFAVHGRSATFEASDTLTLQITLAIIDVAPPFTRGHNPAMSARNVLPETAISLEALDEGVGVDTSALVMLINDVPVSKKLFWFDEKRVRLDYQPAQPFRYNEEVRVTVRARDRANPPNEMPEEQYAFAIVEDRAPPALTDIQPSRDAQQAAPNTAISFYLRDELAGVNADSVQLFVNGIRVQPEISGAARALFVRYQPAQPYQLNERVSVSIRARDLALPPNQMNEERYAFTVVQDLAPPFLTDVQPGRNATRVAANAEISFHLRDEIAGVDSNALVLLVNGAAIKPKLSGTLRDLLVRYQPAAPFIKNQTVSVSIAAQDLSSPPNALREQYSFQIEAPVYDVIAENLRPLGELRAGVFTQINGEVRNGLDAVLSPVRARLLADAEVLRDTVLVSQAAGQLTSIAGQARFTQAGQHEITLLVDDDNRLVELSENNNRQSLFVEIAPPLEREFIVRPNPFTPNDDGFNDAVEFNFSTLGLSAPGLRIFDVDGLAVVQEDDLRSGVFVWRGVDRNRRALPPGIYLYSLQDRGKNVANGYVILAR